MSEESKVFIAMIAAFVILGIAGLVGNVVSNNHKFDSINNLIDKTTECNCSIKKEIKK
jgi:hypothetical protein